MVLKYLPPSPVCDLATTRFMAFARAVWASMEMEPKLMAPGSIICWIISVPLKIRQLQSHLLQISWQSRKQVGPHQCWRTHQKWRVQAGHVACNDVKFPSSILANGQKNRDYYPWHVSVAFTLLFPRLKLVTNECDTTQPRWRFLEKRPTISLSQAYKLTAGYL